MVNIHRIKTLIKLKGMKIGHVCACLGLTHTYFSDVEKGKSTMSDERIYKVADILGTTYEYLTNQTDNPNGVSINFDSNSIGFANVHNLQDEQIQEPETWVTVSGNAGTGKSKLFDLPEVVGVDADHQKMAELLGMIAKKPSAKKDMDDILTYLEFIAKRGE